MSDVAITSANVHCCAKQLTQTEKRVDTHTLQGDALIGQSRAEPSTARVKSLRGQN